MKLHLLFLAFFVCVRFYVALSQQCPNIDDRNVGHGGFHATICFFDAANTNLGCLDCQLAGASGWKCDSPFTPLSGYHHATINGVLCYSASMLPLALGSFEIQYLNDQGFLTFSTESESDLDKFIIEFSRDGYYWQEMATIKAKGNTSTRNLYEFVDDNPLHGTTFYRLLSVDFNGSKTNLSIIVGDYVSKKYLLYPVPVNNELIVEGDNLDGANIQLISGMGEQLSLESNYADAKLSFNFSNVESGVYFLKIENESVIQTKRIVVVHN